MRKVFEKDSFKYIDNEENKFFFRYDVTDYGEKCVSAEEVSVIIDDCTDDKVVEFAKDVMVQAISQHDSSEEVNMFYINDFGGWIDRDTRSSLRYSIAIERDYGRNTTELWLNGIKLTLPCKWALEKLDIIELYAKECYSVTSQHIANINSKGNIIDVLSYNYKVGYPEMIRMKISDVLK